MSNAQRGTQQQYNAQGYAYAVVDVRQRQGAPITVYQTITAMDARGNVTGSQLGGGIINTTKGFDGATGLLETVDSTANFFTTTQALSYAWDSLGNLKSRSEKSGSKDLTESFGYDKMNRLTSAGNATVRYDNLSNITYKSDAGNYSYDKNAAGPHAVIQAGATKYQYDANGNSTLSSDGRSLTYSTFDKVTEVTKDNHKVTFAYGPSRSRYKRVDTDTTTGQVKTTYYVGAVEMIYYSGTNTADYDREYKRQLGSALETLRYNGDEFIDQSTPYLLHDHLGSIDVITDHLGNIQQELSFDAWGKRRNATDWQAQLEAGYSPLDTFGGLNSITTRGFTGHEMVDSVGIIHMNGRIYDPTLGRFLQAGPFNIMFREKLY